MVLFYDLSASHPHGSSSSSSSSNSAAAARERLNREHPLSRLLAAYPCLAGMGQWLDHTDLGNLSAACWQFRENMGQYRSGLLRASLRCCKSGAGAVGAEEEEEGEARGGERGEREWRSFRGGGRCVRDMVAGCRRCGRPYCRNCIHKPSKATLNCRSVPPCGPCSALPPHPTAFPLCRCDNTTWICQGCVDARWYVGGRMCLLCHESPTRQLYRWDMVGKWARTICTWCDGMVWSAKDIKDMADMEALGSPMTATCTTVAPAEQEEEESQGPDAFLSFSF